MFCFCASRIELAVCQQQSTTPAPPPQTNAPAQETTNKSEPASEQ
jgi:hypothetical protein